MITNESRASTSGIASIQYGTSSAFAVLDTVYEPLSDGSGSMGSSASSGGSTPRHGYAAGRQAPATPSRGSVLGGLPSARKLRGTHGTSPQQLRSTSVSATNMPTSVTSPAQNRASSTADYGLGSPLGFATPRRAGFNNTYSSGSPQSTRQHRDSVSSSSQGLRTPQSSGRTSFSSNSRASTMLQDPIASSLTGVSQISVIQEMAFRQGQRDHGIIREHLPASPFYREFDKVWADFYALGKECGGTPITAPTTTPSSHHNFPWPVLINAYTQDLEHPNGTVDYEYVRKMCSIALTCMAVLVGTVIRREGDWRKTVCDVPHPIRQALQGFEDLRVRYESLKRDAREAGAGGLPGGY